MGEIEELREVVREAHGTIKDLTRLLKESREERGFIDAYLDDQFETRVEEQVEAGLAKYQATLDAAIDAAEKSILARFNEFGDILLGMDWESRKAGQSSLPDLLRRAKELNDLGSVPAPPMPRIDIRGEGRPIVPDIEEMG